jgi:hypothetical protein
MRGMNLRSERAGSRAPSENRLFLAARVAAFSVLLVFLAAAEISAGSSVSSSIRVSAYVVASPRALIEESGQCEGEREISIPWRYHQGTGTVMLDVLAMEGYDALLAAGDDSSPACAYRFSYEVQR